MAQQPASTSVNGPLITYKALTLVLAFLVVGLFVALATLTTAPREALATVAIVLAVLSIQLQVQFYISQEGSQRAAEARDTQARADIFRGLEALPERLAARVESAQRGAAGQGQASATAEAPQAAGQENDQ